MKKIGILTLVFYNFGTRLQSYALCKAIEKIRPKELTFEVIDMEGIWFGRQTNLRTIAKKIFFYRLFSFRFLIDRIRWCVQKKIINKANYNNEWIHREKKFTSIISKIPYSSKKYTCEEIRNGALNNYSEILVGSDQVWNGIHVPVQDIYMLDHFKKKGYTYAASFGITSIPQNMQDAYRRRLNNFHSLLIREEEGVNICKSLGRPDAEFVLDPTLLLERGDYESLLSKEPLIEGDYILVYSLNASFRIYKQAYKFAKKNNCKMVVLKRDFCPPNIKKIPNAKELFFVSPEEFLWLIKNAKCVITNSYHGFLFSLIFNKFFYLFLDVFEEENCRMLSLIRLCHLENRVFEERDNLPSNLGLINYETVNHTIFLLRNRSMELLKKTLNQMAKD